MFVVSDFLEDTSPAWWAATIDRGWDVVAVVVQDPVWEQSFPPIGGVVTPFVTAGGDTLQYIRLSEREATERREANEERLRRVERDLTRMGVDTILVSGSSVDEIRTAFLDWGEQRLTMRGAFR